MSKAELWISWRYFLGRRRERFVSIISMFSVFGVTIGVAALIIVLAVMSGFDNDLRDRIVGSNAHIIVNNNFGIMFYKDLQERIEKIPGVIATSAHINTQVFLRADKSLVSVYLRGVEPDKEALVTSINKYLVAGSFSSLQSDKDGIVIGKELADSLGLGIGDNVEFISPPQVEPIKFKVTGLFQSGMYNYDLGLAFISLEKAQEVSGVFNAAGEIGVKLADLFSAKLIKQQIYPLLDASYEVRTWAELNKNFFDALKLEKFAMFIILSLIVLVASFGIASTLIVMVTEKIKDIGILKSIGVSGGGIRNIFTLQGLFIGVIGTGLGVFLGVLGCCALKKYQFIKLPQDIYYLDKLPVYLSWQDVSAVSVSAFLITLIATLYPANKAASLKPVEALRYE